MIRNDRGWGAPVVLLISQFCLPLGHQKCRGPGELPSRQDHTQGPPGPEIQRVGLVDEGARRCTRKRVGKGGEEGGWDREEEIYKSMVSKVLPSSSPQMN